MICSDRFGSVRICLNDEGIAFSSLPIITRHYFNKFAFSIIFPKLFHDTQDEAKQLMNCFRGRRNDTSDNRQYSPIIRKFAFTLFIHSPKAYRYVRTKFGKTLPSPSTLAKWFAKSDCNGEPGILPEAIKTLSSAAQAMNNEGKPFLCALSFDEIAIRKHVQYDHQKKQWYGYIKYRKKDNNGKLPIANNALVFMVTSLNSGSSIPIAYYPIKSLDAAEKRDLLVNILSELSKIQVKVTNITFDGLSSNLAACEMLEASFDPRNPIPFIRHPVDRSKVYIILDPCHMIKLVRNSLGDLKKIVDPSRGSIEWKYFEKLENARVNHRFVTHRLNKRHLQYARNRMNVRLAAQTFSKAVSASMQYLEQIGDPNFGNSGATSHFTKMMNDLFDTMNTKCVKNDVFKSALNSDNSEAVFSLYNQLQPYLLSLKFSRKICVDSRRKTGFVGFLINMVSVRHLYEEYVLTGSLPYLPTFYLTQDPLESFFSRVRSLLGSNDNPTTQQLKSSIRKLLFFNEVTSTEFASCQDNLDILSISSAIGPEPQTLRNHDDDDDDINLFNEDEDHEAMDIANEIVREEGFIFAPSMHDTNIETKEDATIAFIAGSIERKILSSRFDCDYCKHVFDENKIDGAFINNDKTQRPCKSTFIICKHTHDIFDKGRQDINFNYQKIFHSIKCALSIERLFDDASFDHEDGHFHRECFINSVIDEYVRVYGTYVARCITLEQQQIMLRNRNKRTTIFNGQ